MKYKFVREWTKPIFVLIGIIALSFLLRIINLTLWPVFADEAIYIRWSQIMASEPTLRFLPLSDGKQPLFMWILMFLVRRFSDPLFVGRLVSVFSGIGSLVGIFVLSYLLFKSKVVSLLSSFAWAISPYAVFFDRLALVDSILALFGIWTLVFGVLTAQRKRLDCAMLTGFCLGGALLTKSPALFFVIMLPVTALLSKFPKRKSELLMHLLSLVCLWLVTYIIAYGMFNILRLGPNFHLISSRNQDYVYPLSHLWVRPLDPFLPFLNRSLEWIWIMGPSVVLVVAFLGIVINFKKYPREVFLLLLWAFFPVFAQAMFAKVFTARYILFSLPIFFIFTAISVLNKNNVYKKFWIFLFIFFIIHSLWIDKFYLTDPENSPLPTSERSGYLEEWTAGTGIKEVSELIKAEAKANLTKSIVVGTEGYFGTLPDGLQIYLDGIDNVTVIGVGINLGEIPASLNESVKAGNKTYLVINSSRLKFEPSQMGLKIISSYPKAERLEFSHERSMYGPQDVLYFLEVPGN